MVNLSANIRKRRQGTASKGRLPRYARECYPHSTALIWLNYPLSGWRLRRGRARSGRGTVRIEHLVRRGCAHEDEWGL